MPIDLFVSSPGSGFEESCPGDESTLLFISASSGVGIRGGSVASEGRAGVSIGEVARGIVRICGEGLPEFVCRFFVRAPARQVHPVTTKFTRGSLPGIGEQHLDAAERLVNCQQPTDHSRKHRSVKSERCSDVLLNVGKPAIHRPKALNTDLTKPLNRVPNAASVKSHLARRRVNAFKPIADDHFIRHRQITLNGWAIHPSQCPYRRGGDAGRWVQIDNALVQGGVKTQGRTDARITARGEREG